MDCDSFFTILQTEEIEEDLAISKDFFVDLHKKRELWNNKSKEVVFK